MKNLEMADENGNVATITILDDMSINEAKELMLSNGFNDSDNFKMELERYIYRGVYFYSHGVAYCVDYSNQDFCTDSIESMKEFIESDVFLNY